MIRVLFVCHGNICRSPMAEFIFKDMIHKQNLDSYFFIESKATSSEEIFLGIGNPIYPPASACLKRHNIPYSLDKRACQIKKEDYSNYDYILGMDECNKQNMLRAFKNDDEHKIKLLLEYSNEHKDISDPWYSGDFEKTYNDIVKGLNGFMSYLKGIYKFNNND